MTRVHILSVPMLDARRTGLAGGAATLLSSHAEHPRPATSDTTKGGQAPRADSLKESQLAARSGPSPPRRTSPTPPIETASLIATATVLELRPIRISRRATSYLCTGRNGCGQVALRWSSVPILPRTPTSVPVAAVTQVEGATDGAAAGSCVERPCELALGVKAGATPALALARMLPLVQPGRNGVGSRDAGVCLHEDHDPPGR
jgi:hypothetical protein